MAADVDWKARAEADGITPELMEQTAREAEWAFDNLPADDGRVLEAQGAMEIVFTPARVLSLLRQVRDLEAALSSYKE